MKRFLFLVVLAAAGAWYANQQGWIKIANPFAPPAATTAQGGAGRRGNAGRPGGDPIPVLAADAQYQDVPVTSDAVGTIQAMNNVTVRSQVDGKLMQLTFKDGQDVTRGDILARIDPATYQAQYDQGLAKKAQDEATLANAKVDLERYVKLAVGEYGSRQQADTQRALVAQLTAQVQLDKASLDNSKAILDYTTIRAPIDGRTGIRMIDEGNIIRAGDTAGLVTITQLKPISLIFNLPQQQFRAVSAAMRKGAVPIQALDSDLTTLFAKGQIDVVDNQIDQTTGTIKVKASFPNDDLALWPGQFVNVRVFTDVLKQAVVVPVAAVQRGPNGPFVYVVRDEGSAALTTVSVGRQDDKIAVILSGLQVPARVVITGFSRLTDGAKISVSAPDAPAAAPNAAGSPRNWRAQPGEAGAPPNAAAPGAEGAPPQGRGQTRDGQPRQRRAQDQTQAPAAPQTAPK